MSATITAQTRVNSAISFINNFDNEPIYFFAGKVDPWDNESSPDPVATSYAESKLVKNGMVFMKRTTADSCLLGLNRFNWTSGIVYTPWDDQVDMSRFDNWLSSNQPYYVFVQDSSLGSISYNVYMCVDNNYGAPSTVVPFGKELEVITLSDGYKWKFMYDINDEYLNYINEAFIPCPHTFDKKSDHQFAVEDNAIPGTIDRIKIINSGSGYTAGNTLVTITGDGTGATASISYDETGAIDIVTITAPGTGYTYAEILIEGDGSDAELLAVISPSEGHGYNASSQLCASYVLHKGTFIADEDGQFPTLNAYRRIGLLRDVSDPNGDPIEGLRYALTDQITYVNPTASFGFSNRIVGVTSGASATIFYFSGFDLFVSDRRGDFIDNETIYIESEPATQAQISTINNNTDVNIKSGNILYYENALFITRKAGQSETFIFAIEF